MNKYLFLCVALLASTVYASDDLDELDAIFTTRAIGPNPGPTPTPGPEPTPAPAPAPEPVPSPPSPPPPSPPNPPSPPPPSPPSPPPPPPPCNFMVPPSCKIFVEDTLCCEDASIVGGESGLVSTKPWVDFTILCTEDTSFATECLYVTGPAEFNITPVFGYGFWGRQFRFVSTWAGEDFEAYNGTVSVGINPIPSCAPTLYKGMCSINATNYDSFEEITPLTLEVIPAPEYCDNLTTCLDDDWALTNLAWVDNDGTCKMEATGLLPNDFFSLGNITWLNYTGGYQSTCAGNVSEPVPFDSVPSDFIFGF